MHLVSFGEKAKLPPGECLTKEYLGGKGYGLVRMAAMGLPVPPGIVIPTLHYRHPTLVGVHNHCFKLAFQVIESGVLPKGSLVSVRSGAPVSMPGMMDTSLNVKLDATLADQIYNVYESCQSERAIAYRQAHGIPDMGTAVVVQKMVKGTAGGLSGTGVVFSRNPSTGERVLTGEWLPGQSGDALVSGKVTPLALDAMPSALRDELENYVLMLEKEFREMQDVEFTVESGKLWLLQTRRGERTAEAAFKIATDMVDEKIISKAEAIRRVTGGQYHALFRRRVSPNFKEPPTLQGLPASPGVAVGFVGSNNILIREETTPDDFPAMKVSDAIVTKIGGLTCHSAVVARGMNKPCVVGVENLLVMSGSHWAVEKKDESTLWVPESGLPFTVDGNTGRIWIGHKVPLLGGQVTAEATRLISWVKVPMEDRIALTVLDDDLVLPKCGPAYLSLEGLSKAKSARTLIRRLAINELTGVLGIPERRVELRADDAAFLCQLGLDAVPEKSTVPTTLVDALIDALCAPVLPSKLKARWHLQLPKGYEAETERLEEAGWRCVRKIHQLDELYEAEGMVTFDHNNWGKIIKILQRSGRDITVLPQLVDIEAEKLKKLGLQNP